MVTHPLMKHQRLTAALGGALFGVLAAGGSLITVPAHAQGASEDGAALFASKCALCHGPGGTGTTMLGWRLGKERGLLTERTDLTASFVRAIVRTGQRSMPPLTRVEVTDSELDRIAAYLSRTEKGSP